MKKILYILFSALFCAGCSFDAYDYPQIYSDPAVGDNSSMPREADDGIIFAEKNDFIVKGKDSDGIPLICFGIRF